MSSKSTALEAVDYWIHSWVEKHQSRGYVKMDLRQFHGTCESQKIDDKFWNPAECINNRHGYDKLCDAPSMTQQSYLGSLVFLFGKP